MPDDRIPLAARRFVDFLETGVAADGLFTDDVFCDFTMPRWRLQAEGRDATIALRRRGHPGPGKVSRQRVDVFDDGFVIEFEEQWTHGGVAWSAREMARADLRDGAICRLAVYCTGDWDPARRAEHALAVHLPRP